MLEVVGCHFAFVCCSQPSPFPSSLFNATLALCLIAVAEVDDSDATAVIPPD